MAAAVDRPSQLLRHHPSSPQQISTNALSSVRFLQQHRRRHPCRAADNNLNHQLETCTSDRSEPYVPESPAAVSAPAGHPCADDMPHPIFTRHREVLFYIPNVIGKHTLTAGLLCLCHAPTCQQLSVFKKVDTLLLLLFSCAGYARIGLTLAALACARQYPLLCVTTYFLA